ncbi:hypothetical protein RB653_008231 [Dictyostelium firmibasis]|uniref:Transcription elongation factor SPT5 n=1 Tax=Dictyostelium firmibasis TaxID=79012 RepID=A0AAN7TS94_9MYCE
MAHSDDENYDGEENFEDEDEEYDDSEEEDESSSRRNSKKSKNDYFEDEAEADDAEDDYEEDEGEAEDGFEQLSSEQMKKDREAYSSMRERDNGLSNILQKVQKYADGEDYGYDDDEADYDEDLPKQSYWRLKCRVGEEKLFVASMMQKMLNNRNSQNANDHILIKSIMAPHHLSGYVYVEAEREVHVRQAIKGMTSLVSFTPVITPLKDIIEVISANKKNVDLQKGGWVRIRLGKYKADIGQIISYDPSKSRVTVKLIPRLDLPAIAQSLQDKENKASGGTDKSANIPKRKRTRPQARFFNPDEVEKMKIPINQSTTLNGLFYILNGDKYKDGFLHKVFRVASVNVDGVVPSLEELQKFQDRGETQIDSDGQPIENTQPEISSVPLLPRLQTKATHFAKGDTVKVIQGDLKNLMAIVESVEEDRVLILPIDEQIKDLFAFKPYELQKYFKVGDHVKAIGGRYEGETGMVLRVDDLQVVLLSDLTMSEIKVKPQDLQECTEVATGRLELGNYELHDLVQIGPHKVGVIIKVERDSFKILDESSNVSTVKLQEVGNKRRNKSFTTLDAHHNTITSGDLIEVVDGAYKGKQGTILHISRNFLFIKSKDVFENGGVFVVRTQYCSLLGGNKNKQSNIQQQQQQGGRGSFGGGGGGRGGNNNSGGGGGGRGGHGGGRGGRGREDSPLHKVVTIKKGSWKGYVGIVKECTDTMVQVELQTNSKKINVLKTDIILPNERQQMQQQQSNDWDQLYNASRTPMREDPSQTPMRMNTPARSSHSDPWSMRESSDYFSSSSGRDSGSYNNSSDYSSGTTPGTNYSLYSPYTPNTPLDGSNRSDSNYTPYDRSTPSIGGYGNDPNPTPSYLSNYTPHEIPSSPYTPHNPQTPATPNSSEDHDEEVEPQYWSGTKIEVVFKDSGKHAVVLDNLTESIVRVEMLDTKEIVDNVSQSQLNLVPPAKKDRVVIVKGKLCGHCGSLFILTDENTGIVKMDSNFDFKVFKMSYIGKLIR